jgi:hypothetical protein
MKMNPSPAPLRIMTLLAVACLPSALHAQESDAYSAAVLADNPVLYYELQNNLTNSGSIVDTVSQNSGTTTFAAGPSGAGFSNAMADAGQFGGNPDEQIANSTAGIANFASAMTGATGETFSA